MSETAPYVIIGAGPAGVIAAEHIRERDATTPIVIIGDEAEDPYSRMALPYLLADNIAEAGTFLRQDDGHYSSHKIDVRHGRVAAVQPDSHTVTLADGSTQPYKSLLIATGSTATRPPIAGMDLAAIENCWTLEDARKIAAKTQPGSKVVLMGAGFIGCIVLEALAARDVDLTVVEMEDRMVPRMMDTTGGQMIKRWCETKNVRVLTSTRIEAIAEAGDKLALSLADNAETLSADLVVCATGVAPNTAFLDGSGISVDNGIVVDDHMKTSVADVYAAGDVAQGFDFSTGSHAIHAIQPTAADHARVAATNMTGGDATFQGSLSMNVLNTLGLITSSFGAWDGVPGGETATLVDNDGFQYVRLSFKDDVLVGALAIGHTRHVGVLRGLIQGEIALGKWKERLMANPTRVMDAYIEQTKLAA